MVASSQGETRVGSFLGKGMLCNGLKMGSCSVWQGKRTGRWCTKHCRASIVSVQIPAIIL